MLCGSDAIIGSDAIRLKPIQTPAEFRYKVIENFLITQKVARCAGHF